MKKVGYALLLVTILSSFADVMAIRGGGRGFGGARGIAGGRNFAGGRALGFRGGRGFVGGRGVGFVGPRRAVGFRRGLGYGSRSGFGFYGRPWWRSGWANRWWWGIPAYGTYRYAYPEYVSVSRDDSRIMSDINDIQSDIAYLQQKLDALESSIEKLPEAERAQEIEEMRTNIDRLQRLRRNLEAKL